MSSPVSIGSQLFETLKCTNERATKYWSARNLEPHYEQITNQQAKIETQELSANVIK